MPTNLKIVLEGIEACLTLSFIPELLFPEEEENIQEEPERFKGIWGLIIFALCFATIVFLVIVTRKPIQRCRKAVIRRCYKTIHAQLVYNAVIRTFITVFFPLAVKCALTLNESEVDSSWYGALFLLLAFSLVVIGIAIFLKRNRDILHKKRFKQRFGSLYQTVRLDTKWSHYWILLFFLRRLLHALFIGLLMSAGQFQTLYWLSMIMILFIVEFKPYLDQQQNNIELFNNFGLFFIISVSYILT